MGRSATCIPCWPITASISPATTASSNADLAGGPMMDLGSYVTSFALMVGGMPQEIVARGSATAEGLNGQTSMLFSWQERDAGGC